MDWDELDRRRLAELSREIEPDELRTVLQKSIEALNRIDPYPLDTVDGDYLFTAKMRLHQALDVLNRLAQAA
jgi:hypothetical protein